MNNPDRTTTTVVERGVATELNLTDSFGDSIKIVTYPDGSVYIKIYEESNSLSPEQGKALYRALKRFYEPENI